NVTAGNDYYYRICFLDPFQGTVLANFAAEKFSAKKAYCLGELGNEYDQGLVAFFSDAFEAGGGTVTRDSFPTNNSDFTSYLNKAKAEGAEVIFCPVSIAYSTQIIKQAAALGIETPILGSDTLDSNMVLEAAKGTDIKLYVSTFYQEGGSPEFDVGIKEYINGDATAKTNNGGNDTISAVTAMGYDAYYTALEALKAAGSADLAAIKKAMPGVTYEGVSGAIAFDEQGDAIRDTAYIKTADTAAGTWTLETVQKAG
ncbi:MAG: amino acid ABC transporter substrate-binding protein, partial [Clostridia bacterium]|nr:amino acid ABC transporter substrate-binding protein [Clostridia bacterium]